MPVIAAVESFQENTIPFKTNYISKLRTYIRDVEEIIAQEKATAAKLEGDKADLAQKLPDG